jgi:hypothetical protein
MDKAHILREIKRLAATKGGEPLGRRRFSLETGIKASEWEGVHWARWGDAIREAGLEPNQLTAPIAETVLLDSYAHFAIELTRLPTTAELQLKHRKDSTFPSVKTFNRFGSKVELIGRLRTHCQGVGAFGGVIDLCDAFFAVRARESVDNDVASVPETAKLGYVYLIKSGKFYKIGMTNSIGRREYEIALQLPEAATTVHVIQTDDPAGIEAYWHNRFAAKRKNGEWFELDRADVAAFKRRKTFM